MTPEQKWQAERRRCEQFLNAAVIRFRCAVSGKRAPNAYRAATDLAQVIDEMLTLAGADTINDVDCPDCGQVIE